MNFQAWFVLWFALGFFSYVVTQDYIDGWDYVMAQPKWRRTVLSAGFMGAITTLICLWVIYKYHKGGKKK